MKLFSNELSFHKKYIAFQFSYKGYFLTAFNLVHVRFYLCATSIDKLTTKGALEKKILNIRHTQKMPFRGS